MRNNVNDLLWIVRLTLSSLRVHHPRYTIQPYQYHVNEHLSLYWRYVPRGWHPLATQDGQARQRFW
jgi:hypothetical protein